MPHYDEASSLLSSTAPLSSVAVVVGASPYTYAAPQNGVVVVSGGTVSLIQLGRSGVFLDTGLLTGVISVSAGDQVKVTYAVAPTLSFLQSLR